MATYEQLENSSFTDVVVPFISNNGLGVVDACTTQLSGYTLENTVFTFTAKLSSLDNTYIGASMDKLIWDFGDGTYSTGVSVTKHYKYPGEYNVTTIFTDQNGVTHRNRLTQNIKVYNYIPDSLVWYTPTIADPNGGRPERVLCGVPSDDLSIYRMNSWQSWPMVSGDGGYFINLYSTGSKSAPLSNEQYWSDPDIHFTPTWRFIKNKKSKEPIERVQTGNDYIYVKIVDNELVRAPGTDVDAIFAGTSGMSTVNYLDDNPNRLTSARSTELSNNTSAATRSSTNMSQAEMDLANYGNEDKDIILYASFDTSRFPVTRKDGEIGKFELLKSDYFQMYETQKIGMPVKVKFNVPFELSLTSNGINEPGFDLSNYKFINSPISVVTRTQDLSGNIITTDELVPLSSRWTAPTTAFSGGVVSTDVLTAQGFVTLHLSGVDSNFEMVTTPYKSEVDFKEWDMGQIDYNNPASKFVRIQSVSAGYEHILDAQGSPLSAYGDKCEPPGRMRTVTVLFSELAPEQQELLMSTDLKSHACVTGKPRDWYLKNGTKYHGYISPESNYKSDDVLTMELIDDNEQYETPGTYLTYVNLDSSTFTYDHDRTKYRLYAHTLIDPPTTFTYDVTYYYITNPTNDVLWQIKPTYYREYSYGDDGLTQTYTPPISTQTPGNSGMYGMAVDPDGDVIAVDGDTDKIIRYWRNRTSRNEIKICDVLPSEISSNHYPYNQKAYGYSPSSVSMDSNKDYWVTMYDTVSAVKFDGKTDLPIAYAAPPEHNPIASSRTTTPSAKWTDHFADRSELERTGKWEQGADTNWNDVTKTWGEFDGVDPGYGFNQVDGVEGEYGEDIIVPTTVETCKNNDIVVTYTNPLCSFIARYSPTGEMLFKYDFPGEDRYFSGDVCVDVSDHIWALSESTGLNYDGSIDHDPPRSFLHAFDEELTVRHTVSSLKGTDYQDMLKPAPFVAEDINITLRMSQEYDFVQQRYVETGLLIDGYGTKKNPSFSVYEGNTYYFENQYYNNGQHDIRFRKITTENLTTPTSADIFEFDKTGSVITENVEGYETSLIKMEITADTPERFLLVDQLYSNTIGAVVTVVKKPVIGMRPAESFDIINNATHIVPDNNNHIWISWGRRHCSRYHQGKRRFDTTVSVGSAYHDPRYDTLSADTYDRRDNAGRRSAIEGLAMDTANNLLVLNNHDKILYSLNSNQPTLSAYVNLQHNQIPYEEFSWVESLSNSRYATESDFRLYPDSYLTKEQIEVFLSNTYKHDHDRLEALENYKQLMSTQTGVEMFPTHHGSNPIKPTGFEEELCAYGDWTGYRWINKYDPRPVASDETTGFVTITGCSEEFYLVPQSGTHEIVKVNENKDFAEVIRTYMKQPSLVNNTKLYNELNDAIFGTNTSDINSLGKRVYERISNYVNNTVDIDTCTIQSLFGLAEMVNYKLVSTGYPVPVDIQRLIDTLSINFTKLRGMQLTEKTDFEKYGNWLQNQSGVNLGSELLFVFDWRPGHGYRSGDYAKHENEYYECISSPDSDDIPPNESEHWFRWPSGEVRVYTKSRASVIYKALSDIDKEKFDGFDDWYEKTVIIKKKLIQNLELNVDDKIVLYEEYSGKYNVVQARAVRLVDDREYKMKLDQESSEPGIVIQRPEISRDLVEERAALIETYMPLYTMFDDGLITMISDDKTKNMTLVLFRNRTYRFEIEDSIGHPIIITENPGASAEPTEYVSTQYVQKGKITISTYDDDIFGKFPDKLYYQSSVDPSIGGAILIKDVEATTGYSTKMDGLTSYSLNLSVSSNEQLDQLGWGMSFPPESNAWQFYSIFEYLENESTDTTYIDNMIDWDNPMTTLSYTEASTGKDIFDNWFDDGGHVDIMLEKELRKGIGLFSGSESLDTIRGEE